MAAIISQTRKELASSIASQYAGGSSGFQTGTMTGAGSTSTWVDAELQNTNNYINGRQIRFTSGTNDGELRYVDSYVGSTTTGTIRGDVLPAATADGDTYELYPVDLKVSNIYDVINRTIRAIPRKGAPSITDKSIHTSTQIRAFDIPTDMLGISSVSYRVNNLRKVVDNADSAWDEQGTVAGVTTSIDPEQRRQGSGSNKIVVDASVAAGTILASKAISSDDYSGMTHCEFFIRSNVATAAGDLQLILSSSALAGTETELLDVPALVANTWTWVRVPLANPELDTAIISVGLKYTTDIGAATINIDGVEVTEDETGDWATIHRNFWRIDKDQRRLVLKREVYGTPNGASYALVRLQGRKKPTELNADATECDIEPEYIIMQSVANLMRGRGDRRGANRDAAMIEANDLSALALQALANQQIPAATRWIQD